MADFRAFSKIFWNLIKSIGIHYWSKNGVIWSIFCHFMVIQSPDLGHFSLYISIGKIALGNQTCPHVLVSGAFRVDFLYKHMVYRCEALEILYAIVPE